MYLYLSDYLNFVYEQSVLLLWNENYTNSNHTYFLLLLLYILVNFLSPPFFKLKVKVAFKNLNYFMYHSKLISINLTFRCAVYSGTKKKKKMWWLICIFQHLSMTVLIYSSTFSTSVKNRERKPFCILIKISRKLKEEEENKPSTAGKFRRQNPCYSYLANSIYKFDDVSGCWVEYGWMRWQNLYISKPTWGWWLKWYEPVVASNKSSSSIISMFIK